MCEFHSHWSTGSAAQYDSAASHSERCGACSFGMLHDLISMLFQVLCRSAFHILQIQLPAQHTKTQSQPSRARPAVPAALAPCRHSPPQLLRRSPALRLQGAEASKARRAGSLLPENLYSTHCLLMSRVLGCLSAWL